MAMIPDSHKDLLQQAQAAVLGTMMPDGTPQNTVMWFEYDSDNDVILISTTKGRRKYKNLVENPKVSVMFVDPTNIYRYMEVRGTVEITEEGAYDLIDRLAKRYRGVDSYYGGVQPAESKAKEERVILTITPTRVTHR